MANFQLLKGASLTAFEKNYKVNKNSVKWLVIYPSEGFARNKEYWEENIQLLFLFLGRFTISTGIFSVSENSRRNDLIAFVSLKDK